MNILHKINKALEWEPHYIFHTTEWKHYNYSKPRMEGSIFTGFYESSGDSYDIQNYTKLGEFMNKLPILLDLFIKMIYYIPSWIAWIVVKLIWETFKGIFIPSKWVN